MVELVWLIPLLPAFACVVNGLFGRRYPLGWCRGLAIGSVGLAFLLSVGVAVQLATGAAVSTVVRVYDWMVVDDLSIPVAFLVDPLTAVMLVVVTGVGFLIHVYSAGYMHGDPGEPRYFTYLNLFILSMLLLVMADNYVLMFVGWEGVGLCSYLLIGYWYQRVPAATAGTKAFLVNRIGDGGLLLGVLLIFTTFGSVEYATVFSMADTLSEATATAITLLLFIGAVGKSAQVPLYVWLPDAMEGPTPVSALIHAATMVTAGVFMIARNHLLYEAAPLTGVVMAGIGIFTAVFAATIALVQTDIKRVLAYSTVSQLGYMVLACGVGAFTAAVFHLWTHAFFKALLFLAAGSVIHALGGEQDMRRMGGLRAHLPVTGVTFYIGTLALAGIPPLAGFWSKDEILSAAFHFHPILWALGLTGALMTAFYMFRAVYLTFYGEYRGSPEARRHLHESPPSMGIPLIILAGLAVVAGAVPGFPPGAGWFHHFLTPSLGGGHAAAAGESGHTGAGAALILASTAVAASGWGLARWMYRLHPHLPGRLAERARAAYTVLVHRYWVDELYDAWIIQPTLGVARFLKQGDERVIDGAVNLTGRVTVWTSIVSRAFDVTVVDGLVNWISDALSRGSTALRRLQTGFVQHYALAMWAGIFLLVGYYLVRS